VALALDDDRLVGFDDVLLSDVASTSGGSGEDSKG
jgi:hypothetical protein